MSFQVLPPEVTSAQVYTGAGSAPMLSAAASWSGLGSELGSAAESFSSLTTSLPWQGAAAQAMAAVANEYTRWLGTSAAHAANAAAQANATACVFEAAKAAITHPAAVAANRVQLVNLVRSNLFGFNAPAIAATEGAYQEMWAQNVGALSAYHGAASAIAAQLTSWQQTLRPLGGSAAQAATPAASSVKIVLGQILNDIEQNTANTREGFGYAIDDAFNDHTATWTAISNDVQSALGSGDIGKAAFYAAVKRVYAAGNAMYWVGTGASLLIELPGEDLLAVATDLT